MRIAYIIPSLKRTGPNIVVHSIVNSKVINNNEIDIYYFDKTENPLIFPCPTHQISMNETINFDYYDIIHSNMLRPDRYIYKYRKSIKRAKLVTTIHQDIFSNLSSSYNIITASLVTPLWLKYISKFSFAVPISKSIKQIYKNKLNNLSYVIYNGVNVNYRPDKQNKELYNQIKSLKGNCSFLLGTYAQITFRKGIDQIIDVLAIKKDLGAVIIGEGNAKSSLIKKVKELKLDNRVLFLPYVKDPYNYLESIDVYVMPSRSEGFGLAMVEAAITRTPIICSNIDVFREIFNEDQVAFFSIDNIDSLSKAIDKVMINKEILSHNAYERASSQFTIDNMAKDYLNLYKLLLHKKSDCLNRE